MPTFVAISISDSDNPIIISDVVFYFDRSINILYIKKFFNFSGTTPTWKFYIMTAIVVVVILYLSELIGSRWYDPVFDVANGLNGKITLEGEMKRVTLLFSDLRNFTTLVEKHHPTEVIKVINQYFTEMTSAIKTCRGQVLQYVALQFCK